MKSIKYLLMSVLLAGFISCDKEDNDGPEDYTHLAPVEFTHQVVDPETGSSTGNQLAAGREAGIYMLKSGTNIVLCNARNGKYTVATDGKLAATDPDLTARYATETTEYSDFLAYAPYRENVESFIYAADIREQGTPELIDLVYSNNALEVNNESGTVTLEFVHQLSKIYLNIRPGQGLTETDLQNVEIKINGLPTRGTYNLALGRFIELAAEESITALTTAAGDASQIIVYPMADALFDLDIKLANNSTFVWSTEDPVTLQDGKIHVYNVTIGSSSVEVSQGDILDWDGIDDLPTTGTGTGSGTSTNIIYAVGDTYPKDETPIGIVYEINEDGRHGKVISLKEPFMREDGGALKEGARWGDFTLEEATNGVPSITDEENGWEATKELIGMRYQQNNFTNDYAAFYWVYAFLNENDLQGEWYIPAKEELKSLYASISGVNYNSIKDKWFDDVELAELNTAESVASRQAFAQKIKEAGGTDLNLSGSYWSSTEKSDQRAWFLRLEKGKMEYATRYKHDSWGRVRAILVF